MMEQILVKNIISQETPAIDIRSKAPTVDLALGAASAVAALTAASAAGGPVLIPKGVYLIDDDVTCSAPLIFTGGIFSIAAGKTLTINGPVQAPLSQLFTGSGLVSFGYGSISEVFPQWWGAKGDDSTDCYAAILSAITAAQGLFPVRLPAGINRCSNGFSLTLPKTCIKGYTDGNIYGSTAARSTLKFTGGTVGFAHADNAYMTLENLSIDGNNVLEVGWDGAFLSTLRGVTIINCTVAGLRANNISQTSRFINCAFNGNLDGFLSDASPAIGTLLFDHCIFRQNTRYGVNGNIGSGSVMIAPIFESNGREGVNLVASDMRQTIFIAPYFEQNDAASTPSYNMALNLTGTSGRLQLESGIFGSTGETKVANVIAGSVEFRNCSQTGSRSSDQLTVAAGAEVILHNSFGGYPVPEVVKSTSEVPCDRSVGLKFVGGLVQISSLGLSFGSADFAVQTVVDMTRSTQTIRPIFSGNLNGLDLIALGGAAGVYALSLAKTGAAAFMQTDPINLRADEPVHIAYSRESNVGTLWVNGRVVWTGADANNYSGDQLYVGHNYAGTIYGEYRLYAMSFHSAALTSAEVVRLWKNAGRIDPAGIRATAIFNLDTSRRFRGRVYEDVSNTSIAFLGTAAWEYPNPYSSGVVAALGDGDVIPHGMGLTPSVALVTGTVAGEMIAVTAKDDTNLLLAIKKHDGTAGTAQTVYWTAWI